MAEFDRITINMKEYRNLHGEYNRYGDFIYIKSEDSKIKEIFESLLDNKITIKNFKVGVGNSITILNGPFLINQIDEDFNDGTLIILKNIYKNQM